MKLQRILLIFSLIASLALAAPAAAQDEVDEAEETVTLGARARIAQQLWGPRQILRLQDELKITDAQRAAIRKSVKEAQTKIIDLRFDLDAEVQALDKLLAQPRVDEAAATAKSQRVMALESDIKLTTLRMLIQIKNTLTPEQQKILSQKAKRRAKGRR